MAGLPAPNILDPTQQAGREKRAYADFRRRLKAIYAEINERVISQLKPREIALNGARSYILNRDTFYYYELDRGQLDNLDAIIAEIIDRIMMQRKGQYEVWMEEYTAQAYQQGTGYAWASLGVQSEIYSRAYSDLAYVLMTPEYRNRIVFVTSRTFNDMQGFTDELTATTRRILGDTIANGESPREAARKLKCYLVDTEGTQKKAASRAATIARTELGVAYRSAVMDESMRTSQALDLVTKLMWVSALMSTTRKSHGDRHGKLYTRAEVAEFYSRDGNAIRCRCSQIAVIVDEKGEAFSKAIFAKMEKQRERWEENQAKKAA